MFASAHIREVKMKIAAFCLCYVLILTAPCVMAQQANTPNQSWDDLRQLPAGEKLQVQRKTGKKKVSGSLVSIFDTELIIQRKGKSESFSRDEVKNIWRVAPPSRKDEMIGALCLGAGLLFGVVVAMGIALDKPCGGDCADEEMGMVAALVGIPAAGFLAYRLLGKGKRTLIYSAP
jgi:hypothetical protein